MTDDRVLYKAVWSSLNRTCKIKKKPPPKKKKEKRPVFKYFLNESQN